MRPDAVLAFSCNALLRALGTRDKGSLVVTTARYKDSAVVEERPIRARLPTVGTGG